MSTIEYVPAHLPQNAAGREAYCRGKWRRWVAANSPHTVYIGWNADGSCRYVGMTLDVTQRLREHERAGRVFAAVDLSVHPNKVAAHQVEKDLIWRLQPTDNTRHKTVDPATTFPLCDYPAPDWVPPILRAAS